MAILGPFLYIFLFILFLLPGTLATSDQNEVVQLGGPGLLPCPDRYNIFSVDWNRTYGDTEPQQIHLSIGPESKYMTIQFATAKQINSSILEYWRVRSPESTKITIKGTQDWTFVNTDTNRTTYLHNIRTDFLHPSTIYMYRVGSVAEEHFEPTWSPTFEFHTATKKKSFSFLVAGDTGLNNAVSVKHMVELGHTHKYDFVAIAGDQGYDLSDFGGTKGDQYLNFMQQLFSQVPYSGVAGNHESAGNFSYYKNRFNTVPYLESKSPQPTMYSFDYKSLHFVSFSTEVYFEGTTDEVTTALNWLDADLEQVNRNRQERPWIIIVTHRPLYCTADIADCIERSQLIRNGPAPSRGLEPLLNKHKVDLIISGHVHNYERTFPLMNGTLTSTSYHNAPSFFQIVSGNGGQPEGFQIFEADVPRSDWSAYRYAGYGFCTITVSPTSMEIQHHATHANGTMGNIIDRVLVTKDIAR